MRDVSLAGWGAYLQDLKVQRLWSEVKQLYDINALELKVVDVALKALAPSLTSNRIIIQTDNKITKHYLNKQGSTRSTTLSLEAQAIWHWLLKRNLTIKAIYLLGLQNCKAALLRRCFIDNHKWN